MILAVDTSSRHKLDTPFFSLKYQVALRLLLPFFSTADQCEQVPNAGSVRVDDMPSDLRRSARLRGDPPNLRRSARLREKSQKTPHPPHIRRSLRLANPGQSLSQIKKRKEVFPLMRLPPELRIMVYSKAIELGFDKAILRLSKQIREEARPLILRSRFFELGNYGGMMICHAQDPRRDTVLYPRFPDEIRWLDLASHDRVVNKLALMQNLAVRIDFPKLRSTTGPHNTPYHMLRQITARDRRTARIAGDRLPTFSGPPIGLLEPFLSPQSGPRRRNICEITLKNFINYDQPSVNMVLEVLTRLHFNNIFVTFRSPRVPKPGERRGDIRRRFYACQKTLEARLGPGIWHNGGGIGYLSFHPRG